MAQPLVLWLPLELVQFLGDVFPLVSVRQWGFAFGYAFPAPCQLDIEGNEGLLVGWYVFFGVNRIHRAFWDADGAVYAFVGVDDEEVGAFAKAVYGAYIDTVGVFAADTGFGYYVGHGLFGD